MRRRRGSSVASTLDAVRKTTVSGDRPEYLTITDVRSILIVILSVLLDAYRRWQVWWLTAKSVRPKEKSFISAISRFQN